MTLKELENIVGKEVWFVAESSDYIDGYEEPNGKLYLFSRKIIEIRLTRDNEFIALLDKDIGFRQKEINLKFIDYTKEQAIESFIKKTEETKKLQIKLANSRYETNIKAIKELIGKLERGKI